MPRFRIRTEPRIPGSATSRSRHSKFTSRNIDVGAGGLGEWGAHRRTAGRRTAGGRTTSMSLKGSWSLTCCLAFLHWSLGSQWATTPLTASGRSGCGLFRWSFFLANWGPFLLGCRSLRHCWGFHRTPGPVLATCHSIGKDRVVQWIGLTGVDSQAGFSRGASTVAALRAK